MEGEKEDGNVGETVRKWLRKERARGENRMQRGRYRVEPSEQRKRKNSGNMSHSQSFYI